MTDTESHKILNDLKKKLKMPETASAMDVFRRALSELQEREKPVPSPINDNRPLSPQPK